MRFNRGVVYAATQSSSYLWEAFLSAESIKRVLPEMPITLFTDQPEHVLCSFGVFDQTEYLSSASGSHIGRALLNRASALLRSPYEHTLHLDTDTLVLTPELQSLFERYRCVDVAMVEDSIEISYTRLTLGRRMYNGGVILFQKAENTISWLQEWSSISARNFRAAAEMNLPEIPFVSHVSNMADRRKLLRSDQTSLTEILSPETNKLGLIFEALESQWNYRVRRIRPDALPNNAGILHGRYEQSDRIEALRTAVARVISKDQPS